MVGFTIVLKKRKRRKLHRGNKINRRKIFYFLPVILIAVFSVCVAGFFEKEESESEIIAEDIQVFKEIDDFSAYYNPVVMNGFFSYKKGDKIENKDLVTLSVWSILCTEDTKKYQVFDGELSLPKEDVEERVKMLFSEKTEFENTSSGKIVFDKSIGCYRIPTMGFTPEYSAVLKSVTAEKSKTKLKVSCLKNENFKQDGSGKTVFPEAEKNIIIILEKYKNSFYIESISEE